MAQPVTVLVAKIDDLSLMPGTLHDRKRAPILESCPLIATHVMTYSTLSKEMLKRQQ